MPRRRDRSRQREAAEAEVPAWPTVDAVLLPEGIGEFSWNGVVRRSAGADEAAVRRGIIARCTRIAQAVRRPIRLRIREAGQEWLVGVRPEGIVQPLDANHLLPPSQETAPAAGPCGGCAERVAVTEPACSHCGRIEPLWFEAPRRPMPARDGPSSDSTDTDTDTATATATATRASHRPRSPRPMLVIEHGAACIAVPEGAAALGRRPSPVDGRTPVPLADHAGSVSRTHALVDVDSRGRIVVTDYHSTHGVHVERGDAEAAHTLDPGVATVVGDLTRLRLGDLSCTVRIRRGAPED